jgi:hypothetical protein
MIIKEFRIIIPMSVDEYQIGQLYTIQVGFIANDSLLNQIQK